MRPADFRNLNDPEENQSFQFSFNKNYLYCLLIFIFTINLTWRKGIGFQHGSYHCWLYEPLEKSILHNLEKQMLCNRPYIQVPFNLTLVFLFRHISYTCHTYMHPLLQPLWSTEAHHICFSEERFLEVEKKLWIESWKTDWMSVVKHCPYLSASGTPLAASLSCSCPSKPEYKWPPSGLPLPTPDITCRLQHSFC